MFVVDWEYADNIFLIKAHEIRAKYLNIIIEYIPKKIKFQEKLIRELTVKQDNMGNK